MSALAFADRPVKMPSLQAVKRELARRHLNDFTQHTFPDYQPGWHHKVVADALDDCLAGRCRRLMVFQPPQTGKSELVSRRFPAFALGKNPKLRILAASYNADLATDMSRDVQKIMDSRSYAELFPGSRLADGKDEEVKTTKQFQVVGERGRYYAAGVGGGLTGKTADIGVIDDPVKNREEAESKVYREMVWNWYISTFLTRQFGDKGVIIIALTRWHEDDLAGRLLASEPDAWRVIRLEAIADTIVDPAYDPRVKGEALWPQVYPLEELAKRRKVMGAYEWSALYQQQPTPPGGKLFKRAWFADNFVDAAPVTARRVRGWDTAATEDGGDWTVGLKIAEAKGIFYIEHVVRGQWSPADIDANQKAVAQMDGTDVAIREEREGGSSGKRVIAASAKHLVGWDYVGVTVDKDKVTRSRPFRAQCEAGNVRIVRGAWNEAYIDELADFPTGHHDDQVDASSCAFNSVLLEPEPATEATWGR